MAGGRTAVESADRAARISRDEIIDGLQNMPRAGEAGLGHAEPAGHQQCVTCHAMAFRKADNPKICQECHVASKPVNSSDLVPYPRFKGQRPLLTDFSHARHVDTLARVDSSTGFRADCSHCHKLTDDGKVAALPRHAECAGCHSRPEIRPHLSAASTTRDCRGCHAPENIERPSQVTRVLPTQAAPAVWANIKFSHLVHLRAKQQEKTDCVTCHRSVPASANRASLRLPVMLDCVGCHETGGRLGSQFQMSNCGLCHAERLRRPFPPVTTATCGRRPTTRVSASTIRNRRVWPTPNVSPATAASHRTRRRGASVYPATR